MYYHHLSFKIGGLAMSAVESTTVGVNEFWSGDRVAINVV
jgi:hypothetical protein